jgi:mono/diheme cytochrome c family protein
MVTGVLGLASTAVAQDRAALIARGSYIVNNVAGCNDCHSPRDKNGNLIENKKFSGAPLPFGPLHPMTWAATALPIRGLPQGWTEAQFSHFLQTGVRPNGTHPRDPMPPYRMNVADANAVAAYMHSLR